MAKKAVSQAESDDSADPSQLKPRRRAKKVDPTDLAVRRRITEVDKPVDMLDVFNRVMEASRKSGKLKGYNLVSGGGDTFQLGLRIPFVLQYLIGCQVLPLGIAVETNGPPMSCKTMLMYEFARFFKESRGWLEMVLTEGKISRSLLRSVMGWDRASRRAANVDSVVNMNDMMQVITFKLNKLSQLAETGETPQSKKGMGYIYPVMIGVDSIMGANAAETSKKIREEGDYSRSFPVEALILTPFLKETAASISNFPFLLFLINHRKEGEKDPSRPYDAVKATKPGGKQLRFQATYELVTHLAAKPQKVPDNRIGGGAEIENRLIRIDNGKNSAGTDGRSITVRVSWRYAACDKAMADGSFQKVARQLTTWHWDEAIAPLLSQWKKGRGSAEQLVASTRSRCEKLDAVIHIRDAPGGRYYSDTLNIPKSAPVTASKIGEMIVKDEKILEGLRVLFGIEDGYVWQAGVDYRKVRRKLKDFADTTGAAQIDKQLNVLMESADEIDEEQLETLKTVSIEKLREAVEAEAENTIAPRGRTSRYS
jgi:hypothetical protein